MPVVAMVAVAPGRRGTNRAARDMAFNKTRVILVNGIQGGRRPDQAPPS